MQCESTNVLPSKNNGKATIKLRRQRGSSMGRKGHSGKKGTEGFMKRTQWAHAIKTERDARAKYGHVPSAYCILYHPKCFPTLLLNVTLSHIFLSLQRLGASPDESLEPPNLTKQRQCFIPLATEQLVLEERQEGELLSKVCLKTASVLLHLVQNGNKGWAQRAKYSQTTNYIRMYVYICIYT